MILFKLPHVFSCTRKLVVRLNRFSSVGLRVLKLITFKINCVLTCLHTLISSKYTPHLKKWDRFFTLNMFHAASYSHLCFSGINWRSSFLYPVFSTTWSSMHLSRSNPNIRSSKILLTLNCWMHAVFQIHRQGVK